MPESIDGQNRAGAMTTMPMKATAAIAGLARMVKHHRHGRRWQDEDGGRGELEQTPGNDAAVDHRTPCSRRECARSA